MLNLGEKGGIVLFICNLIKTVKRYYIYNRLH